MVLPWYIMVVPRHITWWYTTVQHGNTMIQHVLPCCTVVPPYGMPWYYHGIPWWYHSTAWYHRMIQRMVQLGTTIVVPCCTVVPLIGMPWYYHGNTMVFFWWGQIEHWGVGLAVCYRLDQQAQEALRRTLCTSPLRSPYSKR